MVSLDLEIVLQVFENLLSNAMRYADTAVSVACRTKGKKLLITVADDGKGFNSNALKIATDPFYTTEKKSEGEHFGLGLNISKVLWHYPKEPKKWRSLHYGMLWNEKPKVNGKEIY